ncbi:MAG: ferrochelatase [Bdellovibrionales bacterium RIFOXYA1_FULL_36_14]|nr:MAG: ferrochelatase [Bdellovibrionales bacterium RIFOXYA1_FULL_36_14]
MGKCDCKLILMQIGSPAALSEEAIQAYLYEFLSNKKVVDLPHFIWLPILKNIILRFRVKKLLKRYEKIWDGGEFLLVKQTRLLCEKLQTELKRFNIECDYAFYYGKKNIKEQILKLSSSQKNVVLPLFPQYSRSTWGIAEDFTGLNCKFLPPFYEEDFYIDNVLKKIEWKISEIKSNNQAIDIVLISFHSAPLRQISKHQDPYLIQCEKTFQKLKEKLEKLTSDLNIVMCFQSKFGKGKWAGPLLEDLISVNYKGQQVVVVSPSFITDSLETEVEINQELRSLALAQGGQLYYVNCLNTEAGWIRDLAFWINRNI